MVFDVKKINCVRSYFLGAWVRFCGKSFENGQISVLKIMLSVKLYELMSTPGVLVNFKFWILKFKKRILNARLFFKLTFLKAINDPKS